MDDITKLNEALVGRYIIEREVGRGGMATVYLARDARHQRQVAIKVLDPELGAVLGAERFLGEIRVTANLQHPNLLPLFDSGEAAGRLFYVMPFVDGESLRARLDREQQLLVEEALRIAIAVANALEHAHARGVIHRDLKPENILLQAGQPVVADFGIALAVSKAGGARVTQTGLSLGTPQYMSPEQATGDRGIDARSDIYSLGAVTYEMLTGEPPHVGNTAQAIIAKLMTEDVRPLTVLRRTVPPLVDAAVRRALERLPADRFATAKAFSEALGGTGPTAMAGGVSTHASAPSPATPTRAGQPWRWALVAAAGVVACTPSRRECMSAAPTVRFEFRVPHVGSFANVTGLTVAITPHGDTVVTATADSAGTSHLYARGLSDLDAKVIRGSDNALFPTISPTGGKVAFVDGTQVKVIPIVGGAASLVASFPVGPQGLAWDPRESSRQWPANCS